MRVDLDLNLEVSFDDTDTVYPSLDFHLYQYDAHGNKMIVARDSVLLEDLAKVLKPYFVEKVKLD